MDASPTRPAPARLAVAPAAGWSFAARLGFVTSVLVVTICVAQSWLVARGALGDMRTQLRQRGRAISEALAHDAGTALTRGSLHALGSLVEHARAQADVVSVRVFDANGLVLASGGSPVGPAVPPTTVIAEKDPSAVVGSVWEFQSPIAGAPGAAPLGAVTVGISLAPLEALQHRIALTTGIFTALFVLIGVLGMHALARALTRPLAGLAAAADAFAAGKLETRVGGDGRDEIGALARSFNAMAASLATKVRELERANHLKSEFLATVSHELRTPLNVILGYVEMLEQGAAGRLSDSQADMLTSIRRYSALQLDLVTSVLDFTQLSSGHITVHAERFVLASLLEDILALHGGTPKSGVQLIMRVDPRVPVLETDRIKLHQIVRNLVDNAVKFTEAGRITVDARPTATPDRILLTVSDTGPGISAHDLPNIFDPFRQLGASSTRRTGGVGLGLSIVAHLVQALGGNISVVSEVGRGSVFRVEVPVQLPSVAAKPADPPTLAAAS